MTDINANITKIVERDRVISVHGEFHMFERQTEMPRTGRRNFLVFHHAAQSPFVLALWVTVIFVASTSLCWAQQRSTAERRRDVFQTRHKELLLNLRHEISELSQQCYDAGLTQAAKDLTAISLELTDVHPNWQPPRFMQLPVNADLPEEQRVWRTRLQKLREDKAQELYVLARQTLRAGLPTLAYRMINDVLRLDSDHKHSRSILGQQPFRDVSQEGNVAYAGEWVSPFEARKRSGRNPEIDHPDYGWIPVSHIARFDEGQRPWRGKWISVQKESELRRDFANAWEIETEHFLVKTNTSLKEGVEISRKLEVFHSWLTSNFAAFFDTPDALAEKFEQAHPGRRTSDTETMEVHYYASRDEYNQRLRGKIPPDRPTNGVYWEDDRTSYFFRNPEDSGHSTVFHEATHQILDLATIKHRQQAARTLAHRLRQRQPSRWRLCSSSNFWIIEGLASYFESFEVHEGVASVGRPDYIRFMGAQQRLLDDAFYVPLQGFCGLGNEDFMQHPNVAQFYTQASGLTHFLLHYDDGVYRDDLVSLLAAVYRPDLKNLTEQPSLEKLSGVRFAVLDQQYRDHMENLRTEVVANLNQRVPGN